MTIKCLFCKIEFKISPSRQGIKKFCSKTCYSKELAKRMTGKGNYMFGIHLKHSEEAKKKIGLASKGNKYKLGKSPWNKGIHFTQISGKNHWNWQDGKTKVQIALRMSLEYEEWRKSVFERDLYTCQECGSIGEYLHADHIKPFNEYPELRFEVSNGRTLCVPCHFKITFHKEIPQNSKWGHYKGGKNAY